MLSRILVLAAGAAAALAMATPAQADICVYYLEGSYGPLARHVSVGQIGELIGQGPGGDMGEVCIPFE